MRQGVNVDPGAAQLLLAIARYGRCGGAEEIARAAATVRDWRAFTKLARKHRLSPQAYNHLEQMGDSVPAEAKEQLRALYERNVVRSMTNAAELYAVMEEFSRCGIRVLPFKGIALGMMLYGNVTDRSAGDLDLLIFERDAFRAASLLLDRGFDLETPISSDGSPAHQYKGEYHFERRADGMVVELRWRLDMAGDRFRRDLGLDWFEPKCNKMTLAGFAIPQMDSESTLLMLCMHGSKHLWSRLNWIVDVAQLLTKQPELDWERAIADARRLGLERPLALGALLAHRVCGASVPNQFLRRFESFKRVDAIARIMETTLPDPPGSLPESIVPYSISLLDVHDRLAFLLSTKSLQPNERDREFLPLPKFLSFLYILVRPVRIAWDRSART